MAKRGKVVCTQSSNNNYYLHIQNYYTARALHYTYKPNLRLHEKFKGCPGGQGREHILPIRLYSYGPNKG